MTSAHESISQQLAAYAFDSLRQDEVDEVRQHIAACERCRVEVAGFDDVLSGLTALVPRPALPDDFADRVLRAARPTVAPTKPARRLVARLSYAALFVVIALLAAGLLDAREQAEMLDRSVARVARSSDGIQLTDGRRAVAKVIPGDGRAVFVVSGLDEPPDDRVYQLWLMRGSCDEGFRVVACIKVRGPTFDPTDGVAVLETRWAGVYRDAAVTIEPDGGSSQPTSAAVMSSVGYSSPLVNNTP